jgi:hypothetical protein
VPQKTVVQLGPFDAQYSCENARHGIPDMIVGKRLDEKDKKRAVEIYGLHPNALNLVREIKPLALSRNATHARHD